MNNPVSVNRMFGGGGVLAQGSIKVISFWFLWFAACFIPFSLEGGYSANYLFALTPLVVILRGGRLYMPRSTVIKALFIVSCLIFVTALIYQVDFYEHAPRRFVSFAIFMTIFSLAIIRFTREMTMAAMTALIAVSLYYSLASLNATLEHGLLDPASLKDLVGTQRIGFLYLFAISICLVFFFENKQKFQRLTLLAVIAILIFGLVLTFSRSSYVAIVAGVIFAYCYYLSKQKIWLSGSIKIAFSVLVICFFIFFLHEIYPDFFLFLDHRLLSLFLEGQLSERLKNPETSEGARLAIWGLITNFVLQNPFTGSGFLGAWVLSDWSGSAHNEFMDRFLRLGLLGFALHLFLIWKIFGFLVKLHPMFGAGFFSVLVYGMFHETFSQSHASVLLSILISLCFNSTRNAYLHAPHSSTCTGEVDVSSHPSDVKKTTT